jgi:tetratricopeptide (TPR) repeat protein
MGNRQPESPAISERAFAYSVSDGDVVVWLEELLTTLETVAIPSGDVAEIQWRLKHVLFSAVLPAVERARPGPAVAVELAFYRRWIDANNETCSPLYAAWFSLGILFVRAGDNNNAAIAYGNALALLPDLHCAAINLGLTLDAAGNPEEALATWQRAANRTGCASLWKSSKGVRSRSLAI